MIRRTDRTLGNHIRFSVFGTFLIFETEQIDHRSRVSDLYLSVACCYRQHTVLNTYSVQYLVSTDLEYKNNLRKISSLRQILVQFQIVDFCVSFGAASVKQALNFGSVGLNTKENREKFIMFSVERDTAL